MLTVLIKHDVQLHKLRAQMPPPAFHTAQTRISSVTGLKPFSGCSCWLQALQPLFLLDSEPAITASDTPALPAKFKIHPLGRSKLTAWTSRARTGPLKGTWFWDNSPSRACLLCGLETDATKLQMYVLQTDPNTNLNDCLSPSCYKIFFLGSDLIFNPAFNRFLSHKL